MKINGRTIVPPPIVEVKLYRPDGEVVIKFQAVLDIGPVEAILGPEPEPPVFTDVKTKIKRPRTEDPAYRKRLTEYEQQKAQWIFLRAIEPSQIEWETVDMMIPASWGNTQNELDQVFTRAEQQKILKGYIEAQNPSGESENKAIESFIQGLFREMEVEPQPEAGQKSETVEQNSGSSGEPVNASV